jgi:very-short-patch-repair endonuclease
LFDLGVGPSAVDRWRRMGRLHRLHRGVYAVGHPGLSQEGRWMAAVLAAGPDAVLSHRSAANLWGVSRRTSVVLDVTTPHSRRTIRGVAVHRTRRLEARDTTERSGIPTTTLGRTLVDLAEAVPSHELQRALHQAEIMYSLTSRELCAAAIHGRKHAGTLAAPRDRSRSELERDFKRLCERHEIERPQNNAKIEGMEVDFVWPERGVVVELDGWRYHRTRHAFETDRERDAVLATGGWRVLRFSYRQVTERPATVARTLKAALCS